MPVINPGPVPQTEITEKAAVGDVTRGLHLPLTWRQWFINVLALLTAAPAVVALVELEAQNAAVATTTFPTGEISTSLFRVSWYLRVVQAATTSSSATLTLGWTDETTVMSFTDAAVNGNTVNSFRAGSMIVGADFKSNLTYSVAYASVGATPMKYKLSITVEEV